MKKILAFLLAIVMIAGFTACNSSPSSSNTSTQTPTNTTGTGEEKTPVSGSAETIVFKAAQESDSQNSYGIGLEKLAELINEKSDGRYQLDVYHSGQLGTEAELVEGITMNTVDIVAVTTSIIVNTVPEYGIFDLPYMLEDFDAVDLVFNGDLGREYLDMLADYGIVGLRFWVNGFRCAANSKHPINTPEDFVGIKMRTMNNPVHITSFEALGAVATPMAYGEVYTAIQQGTVDGMEAPIQTIYSSSFYEVAPYVSITNHVYSSALLLMSESCRSQIPEEDWAIWEEALNEASQFEAEYAIARTQEGIEAMTAAGSEVNEVQNISLFAEAVTGVYAQYYDVYGQDAIQRILDVASGK